jgi:hypothetical protein
MMAHISPPPTCISNPPGQVVHENKSASAREAANIKTCSDQTSTYNTYSKPKSPSSPEPSPKKRNYCRHWVHHGTCKWGPYCRFTHIMPATLSGLSEVGLREFLSWWTAAMGLVLASPLNGLGEFGPRKMPYRDVGVGLGGMGYGYGMPGFMPGYGPGGYDRGYGWKDREVHPRAHESERVRRVKAGVGGVMPGMRNLELAEKQLEGTAGQPVARGTVAAQAPAVVRGYAAVGEEQKIREGPEQQMRRDVQQKLVDV